MLFIRMASRLMFLRTDQGEKLRDYLVKFQGGKEVGFHQGMEASSDESTIVFITGENLQKTRIEDANYILLINDPASICLTNLINSQVSALVNRVDMGPSTILMRIAGDQNLVKKEIKELYSGKDLPMEKAVDLGEDKDTILFLTYRQISTVIRTGDLLEGTLLIQQPGWEVFKSLRSRGVLLITRSLEDRKWYELRINIYDSEERYEAHYDRLNFVLSKLEVGMVLEEGWTKDHALVLFSVLAYQIKLFTFYKPEEIKRILTGLEYDQEGKRLADFDLYYRNKKISWVDIDRSKSRRNKVEEGIKNRKALLNQLTQEEQKELKAMEDKIKE
ncbi:hypothetical protein [Isachenkonia alkalipeptolytica]|uniref:Uncharacterized protein n=1 Tax=Isachenkonia alkalipeptolytica TaxID=2565777 RepID=A0AA43XI42_9CLOT|nr:hypothetical protein [Isachenkonia alkalipeptolytica]NBG87250.1 hypothetical protein [Isachenkonia alkalipeptolytica]